MSKFGFATVTGNWNSTPSGIYTYSAEYADDVPEIDIYRDLRANAARGRSGRWASSSDVNTVTSAAILPGTVSGDTYSHAVMSIDSWWYRDRPSGGAEATIEIVGEVSTAALFEEARKAAIAQWQHNAFNRSLGYVAVGGFVLLHK